MRRRTLRIVGIVCALLVILVLLLWRRRPPPPPAEPVHTAPVASGTPWPAGATRRVAAPPNAGLKAGAPEKPDPPPVIDDVIVEKPEVCSGEENLVTVKAHTVNGTDAFLHYVIDGKLGSSVPVQLWLNAGKVSGEHTISVFGRGNTRVTIPLPKYTVKSCQAPRFVAIESRILPNTWSEHEFLAKVVTPTPLPAADGNPGPPPATPFTPVEWRWWFGDGATATTRVPLVRHDYEDRPQTSRFSYFPVKVEVVGQDGTVLTGRSSLALVNTAFEALATKGTVALLIALTPRFPELGPDGKVNQVVRIWHNQPGPVTIERVTMTRYLKEGGETPAEDVPVASVLGTTVIPPGKAGITTRATLDTNREGEVLVVTYRLDGRSEEGYPVVGSFSVMQPPPRPTAQNSMPVVDPVLKAKIIEARRILGREVVNEEDLWRLEREGRFSHLNLPARDPNAAEPVTTEPVRPEQRPRPGTPLRGQSGGR